MKKENKDKTDHVYDILVEIFSDNPNWSRVTDDFYYLLPEPIAFTKEGKNEYLRSQFD